MDKDIAKQLVNRFFESHSEKEIKAMVEKVIAKHPNCNTEPCDWCQYWEDEMNPKPRIIGR